MPNRTKQTHVEDVKDSDKVLLPSCNLLLVAFRKDESGHHIPFTLLDDFLLDPGQSSADRDVIKWLNAGARYWFSLPGQTSNRIEDRLVEFIQAFPLQSPVEHLTHVTASPAKVDEILIVGHRILERCGSEDHSQTIVGNVPVS